MCVSKMQLPAQSAAPLAAQEFSCTDFCGSSGEHWFCILSSAQFMTDAE